MTDLKDFPFGNSSDSKRGDFNPWEQRPAPDGSQILFTNFVAGYNIEPANLHIFSLEDENLRELVSDGSGEHEALTAPTDDARQPNYSSAGDLILYQRFTNDQWDIWLMSPNGENQRRLTNGEGSKTDATFSPDGRFIVYSADNGELEFANLFILPVEGGEATQLTFYEGYDGAPS